MVQGYYTLNEAAQALGMPPDEFTEYVKSETVKWGKLVRDAGIRAN